MRNTVVLLAVFFLLSATVSSQAPGPQPNTASGPTADDCMTKLMNMSDCLSYVTAGSNATAPDKACCPELAGLVDSNPICLCQLLGKSDSFGFKIDKKRALKLPSVCGVTTPPVNMCSVAGVPMGSPTGSQASIPPGGADTAAPGPGGSAATPSTQNNGNGASTNVAFALITLLALLVSF